MPKREPGNPSRYRQPGETFRAVLRRRFGRRRFLRGAAVAMGAAAASSALPLAGTPSEAADATGFSALRFQPVEPSEHDWVMVSPGFRTDVLLRWGDPLFPDGPAFDPDRQSAEAQARQFGFNCDYVAYMPLPAGSSTSTRGLLWVNHETTTGSMMFAGYDPARPTREQVEIEIAGHGGSVVEVWRGQLGWRYSQSSPLNRRITMSTPCRIAGPAAGHDWMKTGADPTGTLVLGTMGNCAGGVTPWGTVLTAEENFQNNFGNLSALPTSDPRQRVHARYGIMTQLSRRAWEMFHPRFDAAREPNESFRFGWIVEIDPYDPGSTPTKRTALGRFRHECATTYVTTDNRVALYSGDDERFEGVYKFVTARGYNPGDRAANRDLLDDGTLYVAKFSDDGTGEWVPLVHGQRGLTAENGFDSQGMVATRTREAAERVGYTRMDRPEDVEVNPATGKLYVVLTSNDQRGTRNRLGPDRANPRAENRAGHILEISHPNDDHTSTSFAWEVFMLCGDPKAGDVYFGGYDPAGVSAIAVPDNLMFDNQGNMWVSTDGMESVLNMPDGLFGIAAEGPERGRVRRFLSVPVGGEATGPVLTPDDATLFLAVQHPGAGGTVDQPRSHWPDGVGPARPTVVVVTEADNVVGDDASWAASFARERGRAPAARDWADRLWSVDFLKRAGRPPSASDWVARANGEA
jgi:secreted PhoX family phosphatase